MKLIDILVEELPKRSGWPEGADYCIQHAHDLGFRWVIFNKGIVNSTSADAEGKWEMDWKFSHKHDFRADELASDHTTAIITREQYEAALSAKNDGWIDWGGGECPLHHGVIIDAKDRDGYIHHGEVVGESIYIDDIFWRRGVCALEGNEIIAYRLHQPQESEQTKEDDEANLNECIGQDAAPVWNGEGLPPVGCEFEYGSHRTKAKCLAVAHHMVFASKGNPDDEESDYEEFMISILDSEFHRVRTEAERKREEAVKTIMLTGWCQAAAEEIYDLVAAGKVPGMSLED